MIRVRRSYLEDYRRAVETEWGSEDELAMKVRGEPVEVSWKADAGTAWDLCVERPFESSFSVVEGGTQVFYNGDGCYRFRNEAVNQARDYLGPGKFKALGSKRFQTPHGAVEVTGEADHLSGIVVQDVKLKFELPDPEEYEQSLQWRVYLHLFDAHVFRYVCFHAKEPDASGFIDIKNVQSFKFWRYPDLKVDVAEWVCRFAEWAAGRGLLPYLTPGHELYQDDRKERPCTR